MKTPVKYRYSCTRQESRTLLLTQCPVLNISPQADTNKQQSSMSHWSRSKCIVSPLAKFANGANEHGII
ncbi:hypothetical protein TNCV_3488651 [Trichonephila clavipes]|nr:hypothetical protein TNCV_3488651 [Trichonephila clavipes]